MSKEIDGHDFVQWEYQKHMMCHICDWPQPDRSDNAFEMVLIGNGSTSDSVGSTWECKNCKTQIIVNHTFRIDSVEVIRKTD